MHHLGQIWKTMRHRGTRRGQKKCGVLSERGTHGDLGGFSDIWNG